MRTFHKVSVIGLGYIGCPTAVVLASHGLNVIGVDVNESVVESVNRGAAHIVEPGLEELLTAAVCEGRLKASTAAQPADAFIIAVPTPFRENHAPDLSYIEAACASIAPVLSKGSLVVLESTSPVGTTEWMATILEKARPDLSFPHVADEEADVQIAYCPERVLPGKIIYELIHNDRVIGGMSAYCAERACTLYETFVKGNCLQTDARTAEMVKLAENAYRDVNIAFANELSLVCDELNIDVWNLIELANLHPRVNILQPGPGVGGHCIAVDPWFIVNSAPETARLIATARKVNDSKPAHVVKAVKVALEDKPNGSIACLGLSFKADIDDLRESPAVKIVECLQRETKAQLLVVEPYVNALPGCLAKCSRTHLTELNEALERADVVLVLVNHKHFYSVDAAQLTGKTLIDTRGLFRGLFRSETGVSARGQRRRTTSAGAAR